MQKPLIAISFQILILLALLPPAAALSQSQQSEEPHEPPLRLSESIHDVAADLDTFIPGYMREQSIPGVSAALVRGGAIVWSKGYGDANAITGETITEQTLFEVASNSKVVAAYIALRLVDQGKLALDRPLNSYLPEPWLPPSPYRDAITLRQVLSHTAGLGHNTLGRDNILPPGQGYSYSAIGFLYLQEVIEQVTGRSLEDVAKDLVFTPLGMSSASFMNLEDLKPQTANGHLHAIVPLVIFAAPFLLLSILVSLIGILVRRLRTGRWRPGGSVFITAFGIAFVLSLILLFVLLGSSSLTEFAWLIAIVGTVLVLTFWGVFHGGRTIIRRLPLERRWQKKLITVVWILLIVAGQVYLFSQITNLPVPKWPSVDPNTAGTLRTTPTDLAKFLLEVADPKYLSADLAVQMRTPQIALTSDLSWGLGAGIQHSTQGDALWQWGQHVDFQSVMIIYPQHRCGVVVCTNNDLLNPDVAIRIAHRALGGKIESIRQASHLRFNYRPPT